ncbi:hypothetical protein QVD17_00686 [Tagetes erecta]|uniref:Uncharacterized protein n=1 Tax=Tagetes erecta TaxID=13708 RepID=A0AAD8L993_TARER|nr:hypothetical protein QVD17_00686 [Tagetes erecta]
MITVNQFPHSNQCSILNKNKKKMITATGSCNHHVHQALLFNSLTEDHTPMNAMNDHRESYAPETETSVPVSVTKSGASPDVSIIYGESNLCYRSTEVSSIRDCKTN